MNYIEKIKAWFEKEKVVHPKGGIYDATIYHDDNCDIWVNKPCNCDADVKIKTLANKN
jgi:hypothetical protein